jgi:pimeloyl-ACP methyl ester carboxylesterase
VVAGGHRLEYVWHGPPPDQEPTLVFLHEGLGCVATWKEFPQSVAEETGCGALVYSRWGYGASDPVTLPRPLSYMQDEAKHSLPDLLSALSIRDAILVGHSDGASIAIVYCGGTDASRVRALVLEAPHVFVEEVSVRSIEQAADQYRNGDLAERLQRRHGANTDSAFWGWNSAWLDPKFRAWNIEEYLPAISVPTLIIQGVNDEYGTVRQVDAIATQSGASVETRLLEDCGHSPHRDQPELTRAAMVQFVERVLRTGKTSA